MNQKLVTARIRQQIRHSWRRLLCSVLRMTYRLQDNLEGRLVQTPPPEGGPKS